MDTTAFAAQFPDILTAEEVCKILSISKKTFYKLCQNPQFPRIKIGREYRVPKKGLYEYMHNSGARTETPNRSGA